MISCNKDKLLFNNYYVINDRLKFKHPTIKEILELDNFNHNKYLDYIQFFAFKNEDYMVELHDEGIYYTELDQYDLFIKMAQADIFNESMSWWINKKCNFVLNENTQNNTLVLYDENNDIIIDKMIYNTISSYIKTINNITIKNKYNFKRKRDIDFHIRKKKEDLARKQGRKSKNNYIGYLHDVINSIAWVSQSVNIFNVFDLTIYQLYQGLEKIQQNKEVEGVNIGLYTGNIDPKKNSSLNCDWINSKRKD